MAWRVVPHAIYGVPHFKSEADRSREDLYMTKLGTEMAKSPGPENIGSENAVPGT